MSKPASKFEKKGDTDGIKAGVAKVSVNDKKKKHEESEEEEEEEDDEDEENDDEDDDGMGNLPPKVLKRVVAIRKIHESVEAIDLEYKKERIALEQKYLALKQPLYVSRNQFISGEVDVPVEEASPDAASEPVDAEDEEDVKGIPGFWLQCLGAHHVTGELIAEEDVPALEALTAITCSYDETFTSFTLTFTFAENEFFTNTTLTKKYDVTPDLLDEKAPALTGNEGTAIDWKAGKNLTVTEIKKKQKAKSGRNKGQVRTVVETVPKASFFHFFSTPTGDEDEEEPEEDDEEGHQRIKLSMEEDYDVGHTIRTAIIPEAVLWYTGEAVDDEYDEDDEEGMYGESDEDEDEEEESDEEEEGAKDKKKKTKVVATPEGGFASAGGAAAPGANGEQPECKQN